MKGIWSLLVIAYLIISSKFLPELYNYWAQAVAEGVTIVFWFAGFIALATTLGAESRPHISWYKTGAAACAFAAFTWSVCVLNVRTSTEKLISTHCAHRVSFVVTGVLFGLALKKHLSDPAKAHLPRSGLPYDPHTSGPAPTSPGNVEMGNVVVANPGPQQQYPMATQTPVPMQTGAPEPYQMQPQSPVYPAQTATPVHMYSPTPPPHGQQ